MQQQQQGKQTKSALRGCRAAILSDLDDHSGVLEALFQSGIICGRQYQIIRSKTIQFDAVSFLLDCVERAGLNGFRAFCDALKDDYPWIREQLLDFSQIQTSISPGSTEHENTPQILLNPDSLLSCPSEKELLGLSKTIAVEDWEALALELGLTLCDIAKVKHSSSSSVLLVHSMLIQWKRQQADDATRQALATALQKCDMDHVLQNWKMIG